MDSSHWLLRPAQFENGLAQCGHLQNILYSCIITLSSVSEQASLMKVHANRNVLNNRSQRDKNTPIIELKKALKTAEEKFPEADIYIPVVNFSPALPQNEQETLLCLNTFIAGLDNHIPALSASMFDTERDNIHWTDKTAMCMLNHWGDYVNVTSP